MAEIGFIRHLNQYDDYARVDVYRYEDGRQQFLFDCEFTESVPAVVKDGTIVEPSKYSVLVSRIGKTDIRSSNTKAVESVEECKAQIAEYFRTHPMGIAKIPPQRVIFA